MKKILSEITILMILFSITASFQPTTKAESVNPQLTITGLVENPLNLTIAEIQGLPKTSIYAAILCVDFPERIVDEGNWSGVRIGVLLEDAKIKSDALKVVFAAPDGYSSGLTVTDAMRSDVILAYEKDGQALSDLRLVVPGKWGYKWVNQVARIEVVNFDYLGFWESRGYSDSAEISTGQQKPGSTVPIRPIPTQTPIQSTSPPIVSPTTTPLPSQDQAAATLVEPTRTAGSNQSYGLPMEAIYAALAVFFALVFVALFVKKRNT